MQSVGDVLECYQDRVPILRKDLVVSLDRSAPTREGGAPLEDRLCDSCGDPPGEYRWIDSLCRIPPQPAADRELRQHIRGGHADLRARHVQERLVLADVRSLLDELRRQTQRQVLRQQEVRQVEILADILAGKVTGEKSEQISFDLQLLI